MQSAGSRDDARQRRGRLTGLHAGPMIPAIRSAVVALGAVLLAPSVARANGIAVEYLIAYGLVVLTPVLVFVTVVEAWVMARVVRVPWRGLWRESMKANVRSGLVGIPVSVGNAFLASTLLPHDLHGYFGRLPLVSVLGYATHFAVTLAIEALSWRRPMARLASPGTRWRAGILLANVLTYAVLAPLHYLRSQPSVRGIASFEPTATWASAPATEIYFRRDPDEHLMRVLSDGTQLVELVHQPVDDYRVSEDGSRLLVKPLGGSEVRRLRLSGNGPATEVVPDPESDAPAGRLYAPTWTQEVRHGDLTVRAEMGLGSRLSVREGDREVVLLATNPGFWFRISEGWVLRPCILANGHEVLFGWRDGLYLLDLESRRVGQIASDVYLTTDGAYTVRQESFIAEEPL